MAQVTIDYGSMNSMKAKIKQATYTTNQYGWLIVPFSDGAVLNARIVDTDGYKTLMPLTFTDGTYFRYYFGNNANAGSFIALSASTNYTIEYTYVPFEED